MTKKEMLRSKKEKEQEEDIITLENQLIEMAEKYKWSNNHHNNAIKDKVQLERQLNEALADKAFLKKVLNAFIDNAK